MIPATKNKFIEITAHILIWSVFLIFLLFFSPGHHQEAINIEVVIRASGIFLFFSALVFYCNYLFLIEKFIFNKKIFAFVLINIFLICLCAWLNHLLRRPFSPPPQSLHHPMRFEKPNHIIMFFRMASPFVLPAVMSVAIKITQRWFKAETQRKEAENKNLESELLHLKYQLQPHFFFNSLNNIYSLVSISPERAQEAIHNLSKLMRYLLYETGVKNVKLSEELLFLKQYIQLMELRLTDKTKVTVQIPEVPNSYQIAPLLFLPLIENAYKHSISATYSSFIHFEITITGDKLCFIAENSNFPKTDLDKSGSGIGLENLKKRLNLLYPQQHQFKTGILNEVFRAELIITFSRQ